MSLEQTVSAVQDPAIRAQFKQLPVENQLALQQEILGKVIIDPDFQTLMQHDEHEGLTILNDFARTLPIPVNKEGIGGQVESDPGKLHSQPLSPSPTQEAIRPGEDESFLRGLVDPGVILDPEALVGGTAAGRYMKASAAKGTEKAATVAPQAENAPSSKPTPPPAESGSVPPAGASEVFDPQVKLQRAKEVKDAVIQDVQRLGQTQASHEGLRISRQVVEAVNTGLIDVEALPGVLQRSGLSMQQFTEELMNTYSTAGRQLQQLSQIRKKLNKLAESDPDAAAALELFNKAVPPDTWRQRWKDAYTSVDNVRRGLLVTQVATAVRNVDSQTGRYSLEVIDQALQGTIKGEGMGSATDLLASFAKNLKPGSAAKILNILKDFPIEEAKLLGSPVGELTLGTKAMKLLNTLNIAQEQFFRRAAFDATMRTELRKAGLNVEETLANPSTIPQATMEKAVQKAMEVTFAAAPKPGTLGADIVGLYQKMPELTTVNPFPRFWANSVQFLMDYNPTGLVRLLYKDGEGKMLAANPDERAKILSQAMIGTTMLGGALAIRNSEMAGAKWYEIKAGDQIIDTRPFAPFSTYLFMADVIKTVGEMGTDVIQDGKSLKQAMIQHGKYTTLDLVQGFLSINRVAGTGLVAVDLLKEGTLDHKMDTLRDLVAQYMGSFTVPFRTLKDVVAAVSPEEAKFRDVRETLLGPAAGNIPGLSQTLPEQRSPIKAEVGGTEHPLLRQLTGLSVKTANVIEQEMGKLGMEMSTVAPRTGDAELDRAINQRMGPMVEKAVTRLVESPQYQHIKENAVKRVILSAAFSEFKKQARQQLPENLKAKARLEKEPANVREMIISLGGPDLKEVMK